MISINYILYYLYIHTHPCLYCIKYIINLAYIKLKNDNILCNYIFFNTSIL